LLVSCLPCDCIWKS